MEPSQNTQAAGLSQDLYYQVVHSLLAALPAPPTGRVEDTVKRDNAAIAQVAAMLPADPEELDLATVVVAANAQALDCLRLARECKGDIALALRCTAQSASMMRQARGARTLLLRLQADRQRRDADTAARELAASIEHSARGPIPDGLAATVAEPASISVAPPSGTATARAATDAQVDPQPTAIVRTRTTQTERLVAA